MVCPFCSSNSRIVNSRKHGRTLATWRRHRCIDCGRDFTTYETIDYSRIYTIQRGKYSEAFQTSKLLISLYTSLDHRPAAETDAASLADEVARRLIRKGQILLTTEDIRSEALIILKRFDAVGALKYQAAHENLSSYRDVRRTLRRQ